MPQRRRLVRVRVTAALAAGLLAAGLAAGCGGDPPDGPGGAPATVPGAPTATATPPAGPDPADESAVPVPEALAFRAPTVDGGELDAATLAGDPVVFWFWASWCPRCAAYAGDLRDVQAEYVDRVHVVGVAGLGSGADGMREFVDTHQLDGFPHLADDDGEVWRRFGVTSQEFLVILDRAGGVVHEGPLGADELRDQLATLAA